MGLVCGGALVVLMLALAGCFCYWRHYKDRDSYDLTQVHDKIKIFYQSWKCLGCFQALHLSPQPRRPPDQDHPLTPSHQQKEIYV